MAHINLETTLLENIFAFREDIANTISDLRMYEDGIYRFYHHSFKVYYLQDATLKMLELFKKIMPEREINHSLITIIDEGTGKNFKLEHNDNWLFYTRPIVEAFFHAKHFLECLSSCVKIAIEFNESEKKTLPEILPYDYATVLYLYGMR
jgi:hypothetical protein